MVDVTLNLAAGTQPGKDWQQCVDASGAGVAGFWYKFSGGNWPGGAGGGPGNFETLLSTKLNVQLSLVASNIWGIGGSDQGFRIAYLTYEPANGDLSMKGEAPHHRTIVDHAKVEVTNGTYAIVVAHKSDTDVITPGLHCHPGWRNGGGGGDGRRS
jgi:hypothetical protein